MFRPRLWDVIKGGYPGRTFVQDLAAGTIVGIVAIPLAVAFAIASGVSPDKGLITAVIAGFLISALGGSNVQIGGPTGAFIVIVYGILSKYGPDGLIVSTIMAGFFLIVLGLGRLGTVIQFIPYPVIVGFTSGIAVIIFSSQINDFLGLGLSKVPADFLDKWSLFITHLDHVNFWALTLSAGTVLAIVLLLRINKRIPAALLALIAGTVAVSLFQLPVETIGSRFGAISGAIALPSLPNIGYEKIRELILPAFSIAMLAGIESLLSAVVADGMTGQKHHSNTELIAQGVANVASALFGGIPATGAIARTATNVKSGAKTPVAGLVHAVFLLGVLLFLSPLAGLIPLASLAGILATVSYNMSEHHTFRMLLKGPSGDILVLIATFFLTVLVDLTIAIPVGILLALLFFIRKMSAASHIRVHRDEWKESQEGLDPFGLTSISIPQDVEVFEIDGPFFFGAAERFKEQMSLLEKPPKVRILRMRHVPSIDASGIIVLKDLVHNASSVKTHLLFATVQSSVRQALDKIGLTKLIGEENILADVVQALDRARQLIGHPELSMAQKLRRGGVFADLEAHDPLSVIQNAVPRFPFAVPIKHELLKSMLEREEMASTGMGHALAFPHPRNPVVSHPEQELIAVGYLKEPVDYKASDGEPVRTVIFIVSATVQSHLKTLSRFVKLTKDPEFQKLLDERAGLHELLAEIEKKE